MRVLRTDEGVRHRHRHTLGEGRERAHLPDHDTAVPALGLGLLDALAERGGRHDTVGRVRAAGGLADDELVEGDAVLGDLEERRAGEGAAGLGQQARAVAVQTLVVELDVVLCTGAELDMAT